ncbi:iso-IS1 ORF2 [Yersinia mollaretii]|uniref:Iso-IS1 ORF2 n=1 Tax=Yersinia mollaretii TaxID=33060 RepID=A0AA36PEB0_YERMO|nr:iso-IS1 ORF2 [Yersinia mollaretii]
MVESMIGLLRQDQSLTQATRCDEGFPSDSQFPVLPSITSPNLLSPMFLPHYLFISCNTLPCDTVFTRAISPLKCLRYSHFSLAIIGCEGSQNLIRM